VQNTINSFFIAGILEEHFPIFLEHNLEDFMFRKNYFTSFLTIALFLMGGIAVFAQSAPVGGRVEMKDADGKVTPVAGALVEVFRTDVKQKSPSATTDKKGNFRFAGLPLGTFILSVSGPGIAPELVPNVKAGMNDLTINVTAGDGKRWSEEEVRQGVAAASSQTQTAELTPEQKKAEAERQKQIADITAKNEKAKKTNEVVNQVLQEGNKAYDAKNYDLAIVKYEEGYQADTEFAGSAPVLLNNKALVLITRGTETYNKSIKDPANKAAGMAAVKKDLTEAVEASDRSLEILKAATSTDPGMQKNLEANKIGAITNRKNAYRLMAQTGVERTKGKEAQAAFEEYLAVETDPAKKAKAQLDLALTMQDSNEFGLAVVEFEKILANDPNNVDALAGIGLSLVNIGYVSLDSDAAKGKDQLQQGANYLQKFVDSAPDTHKLKDEMKVIIASLKEEQKVVPQKGKTTTTTKKKN
jgi:tetratricopeptide (TPR) repeat protein